MKLIEAIRHNQQVQMSRKEKLRKKFWNGILFALSFSIFFSLFAYTAAHLHRFEIINRAGALNSLSPVMWVRTCVIFGYPVLLNIAVFMAVIAAEVLLLKYTERENTNAHPIDRNRQLSSADNYGNAHFIHDMHEIRFLAQIRESNNCLGRILGQLDTKGEMCVDFHKDPKDPRAHINENAFCVGASGTGKTHALGMNYCYQSIKLGHSVILTDPKGELYHNLANLFRSKGYIVKRINYVQPVKSQGWDCMKAIRETHDINQMALLTGTFASAIVSQIYSDTTSVYYSSGLSLLQAVILRIVADPKIPDEQKNIKLVMKWLTLSLDELERKFAPAMLNTPRLQLCSGFWGVFSSGSEALRGNIKTNLTAGMSVLNLGNIADILSTDDIDIVLAGKQPCAYFINFPVPSKQFTFPLALFFSMTFQTLQNYAQTDPSCMKNNNRLLCEVDFYLDEFAQIGVLPNFDEVISITRSYGINVFIIVQSVQQLTEKYRAAETIMSNCSLWLMLGANDMTSAKMFSDRLGQQTITVHSETKYGIRKIFNLRNRIGERRAEGTGKVALINPSEIMMTEFNSIIIVIQKCNPIYANTFQHTMHPYYKLLIPVNEESEQYFYDEDNMTHGLPVRAEFNEMEMNSVKEYWRTHEKFVMPDNIDDAPYANPHTGELEEMLEIVGTDIVDFMKKISGKFRKEKYCGNTAETIQNFENIIEEDKKSSPEMFRRTKITVQKENAALITDAVQEANCSKVTFNTLETVVGKETNSEIDDVNADDFEEAEYESEWSHITSVSLGGMKMNSRNNRSKASDEVRQETKAGTSKKKKYEEY